MKSIELFFIKFILTQITVLLAWQEVKAIIDYLHQDFSYKPMGPYMIKSSKVPDMDCHPFYQPRQYFVGSLTPDQYMQQVERQTSGEGQMQEVMITVATVIVTLLLELISFVEDDNPILVYLDHLFTLLLPHFTLRMNAINWGDTCIERSSILDIISYSNLSRIGPIAFGVVILVLLMGLASVTCQLLSSLWWTLLGGLLMCAALFYIVFIDAVVLTVSSPL